MVLAWESKLRLAADIVRGMAYLHGLGVVHRDLKSHNLLVSDDFVVKIADFGTSRLMEALRGNSADAQPAATSLPGGVGGWATSVNESSADATINLTATMTSNLGSPLWMSPELLLGRKYGPSTDVYAFGMVLFELMTQRLPWTELDAADGFVLFQLQELVPTGVRPRYNAAECACPPAFEALMQRCWATDAAERPTFSDILNGPECAPLWAPRG